MRCLFVDRVQKYNSYLFVSTLTSKNISGTLCVVCSTLNLLFLPFSGILSWKFINHTYPVAVFTLYTPRKPYFFVYNHQKHNIYLSWFPLTFKTFNCTFLVTSKRQYVKQKLICFLFSFKSVIFCSFCSLTCSCISGTYPVAFYPRKTSFVVWF